MNANELVQWAYNIGTVSVVLVLGAIVWLMRTEEGARTVSSLIFLNYKKMRVAFAVLLVGGALMFVANVVFVLGDTLLSNEFYAVADIAIFVGLLVLISTLTNLVSSSNPRIQ